MNKESQRTCVLKNDKKLDNRQIIGLIGNGYINVIGIGFTIYFYIIFTFITFYIIFTFIFKSTYQSQDEWQKPAASTWHRCRDRKTIGRQASTLFPVPRQNPPLAPALFRCPGEPSSARLCSNTSHICYYWLEHQYNFIRYKCMIRGPSRCTIAVSESAVSSTPFW